VEVQDESLQIRDGGDGNGSSGGDGLCKSFRALSPCRPPATSFELTGEVLAPAAPRWPVEITLAKGEDSETTRGGDAKAVPHRRARSGEWTATLNWGYGNGQ
jgi:hypothetical protein